MLAGLGPWLRRSMAELVRHDETVFSHQARLVHVRRQRDAAIKTLARDLGRLRLSIENQYHAPEIRRLGFETPTPRSPQHLLRVAGRVATKLGHAGLADLLGKAWYARPFDPATHHARLAAQVETLGQLLHQVDRLGHDLDRARIRRQRALEEHDTLVREAKRLVGSLQALGPRMRDLPEPLGPPRAQPSDHAADAPTPLRRKGGSAAIGGPLALGRRRAGRRRWKTGASSSGIGPVEGLDYAGRSRHDLLARPENSGPPRTRPVAVLGQHPHPAPCPAKPFQNPSHTRWKHRR